VTFSDALAYVESLDILGMRFGLARMERVLAELGDPHRAQAAIHIVGTNGKSSTTRLLAELLTGEGLRTAAYLSPHIATWTERLVIEGETVDEAAFAAAVTAVRGAVERLGYAGDDAVTQFEVLTAAAFVAVAHAGVDVVAVEAGLGGRFDATNVLDGGLVTVLTNISREHTELLGETEAEIAAEKLAVAPDGSDRLVIGRLEPAAADGVAAIMAARGLSGWLLGEEFAVGTDDGGTRIDADGTVYSGIALAVDGRFQRDNLAVAVAAAQRFLGRPLAPDAVRGAAARVRVPGRLERFAGPPAIVIDGAHNPGGMRALAASLGDVFGAARPIAIVSVLDDKDLGAMLAALVPCVRSVVATRSSHPRAADPMLVAGAARALGTEATVIPDPTAALADARSRAGDAGVLVCGSLYLLGDVRPLLIADARG
jgi:dihydrofolate synthase / folylpolyglutamate synthase